MSKKRLIIRIIVSVLLALILIAGTAAIVFACVPQQTIVIPIE